MRSMLLVAQRQRRTNAWSPAEDRVAARQGELSLYTQAKTSVWFQRHNYQNIIVVSQDYNILSAAQADRPSIKTLCALKLPTGPPFDVGYGMDKPEPGEGLY